MAHSYVCSYAHCIFSTKQRRRLITPELAPRLWSHMGGIARKNKMKALAVGGTDNHVHILLSLPPTLPTSKGVRLVKAGASKWVHDTFRNLGDFAWQEGYGCFSVSPSRLYATVRYIAHQEKHHRTMTFEQEYLKILEKCGVDYDERYVFG